MSGPIPLQPQGLLILEALRLVEGAPTLEATLAATPGAEIKAVLAEISGQGLLLMLPDGRSFTAAGKLPYPAGTELTFRIQPQPDGTLQLKPLSADPPPPSALLSPLVQGEAASLLQRLEAPELPPELMPLKALLDRLPAAPQAPPASTLPRALAPLAEALGPAPEVSESTPPPPPAPTNSSSAAPPGPGSPPPAETLPFPPPAAAPTAGNLTTALVARGIPPSPAAALAILLLGEAQPEAALKPAPAPRDAAMRPLEGQAQAPPAPPPALVEAMTAQPTPTLSASVQIPAPAEPTLDRALWKALGLPDHLIQELLPLQKESAPAVPPTVTPAGNSAEANVRLRQALEHLPNPLAQRVLALLTLLPPAGQGQALPRQDPLAQLIRSLLPQLLPPTVESPLAKASALVREGAPAPLPLSEPATWLRWIKEVTSTLSRPEASPAEAPFHRLQAREGTALFEIPLPWTPDPGSLELWAERDAAGPGREEAHRVLLALNLGRTGELRVALQSGPAGIQAQVVASPGVAARLEALLREELGEPAPFPLQVRAAPDLPPRPRALSGTGLQALG